MSINCVKSIPKDITASVSMSIEKTSRDVNTLKLEFKQKAELSPEIGGVGGSFTIGYEHVWDRLTTTGSSSFNSTVKSFREQVTLTIPPHSKARLSIQMRPLKGRIPLTALYKIKSMAKEMTGNNIMVAMERLGPLGNQITVGDDFIAYNRTASLTIDSGVDARIKTEYSKLDDSSFISNVNSKPDGELNFGLIFKNDAIFRLVSASPA